MSDRPLLIAHLEQVLDALERIPRRFEGIASHSDFLGTPDGLDRLDSI